MKEKSFVTDSVDVSVLPAFEDDLDLQDIKNPCSIQEFRIRA